jgi:hypothetical protein
MVNKNLLLYPFVAVLLFNALSIRAQKTSSFAFSEYTSFKKGNFSSFLSVDKDFLYTFGSEQSSFETAGSRKHSFITKYDCQSMQVLEKQDLGELYFNKEPLDYLATVQLKDKTALFFKWSKRKDKEEQLVYALFDRSIGLSSFKVAGSIPKLETSYPIVKVMHSPDSSHFGLHIHIDDKWMSESFIQVYDKFLMPVWRDDLDRFPAREDYELWLLDMKLSNQGALFALAYERKKGSISSMNGFNSIKVMTSDEGTEDGKLSLFKIAGPQRKVKRTELQKDFFLPPDGEILIENDKGLTVCLSHFRKGHDGYGAFLDGLEVINFNIEDFRVTGTQVFENEFSIFDTGKERKDDEFSRLGKKSNFIDIKDVFKTNTGDYYVVTQPINAFMGRMNLSSISVVKLSPGKKVESFKVLDKTQFKYAYTFQNDVLHVFYQDWLKSLYELFELNEMGFSELTMGFFMLKSTDNFEQHEILATHKQEGIKFKIMEPDTYIANPNKISFLFLPMNSISSFCLGTLNQAVFE